MNKKYSVDEALTEMMTVKSLLIILVTAICFAVLGLFLRGKGTTTTSYSAVSKLQVTQYDANDKVMTFSSNDPAFLNTYLENLKNNKTQKAVKQELAKKKLKLSVDKIDSMVSFESIPQTTLLKLKVSGNTKKDVRLVSQAYNKVALEQYKKDMETGSVKVVDFNQSTSTTTQRMSAKKVVFFAGVLGLFLSAGLIFVRKYFNQKIMSSNFIENRTATNVIADASELQNAATALITRVQGTHQVIGVDANNAQQVAVINGITNQLKEWQFNVKLVDAKEVFLKDTMMIPDDENQLIFVVGDTQVPTEKLALSNVDAMVAIVQTKVTTKDELLDLIKFTKDATIPFIGSLYLK
ncbi:hypothetical protein KNP65_03580 [Latilactobacillus curvatus]|uniref:hypothetical protein n=1 Tax=Latilactobacillus curvatus TaxID=28038 RepID=UPI002410E113|nr:hypothetical protein [Latilactobacillus curvatus]MDG2979018.1 hypothetical protein [Latilactobacillus curvatus]